MNFSYNCKSFSWRHMRVTLGPTCKDSNLIGLKFNWKLTKWHKTGIRPDNPQEELDLGKVDWLNQSAHYSMSVAHSFILSPTIPTLLPASCPVGHTSGCVHVCHVILLHISRSLFKAQSCLFWNAVSHFSLENYSPPLSCLWTFVSPAVTDFIILP